MSRLTSRRRSKDEQDTDLDMVPIMNMFLVLIPFLLMSASFLHLKAINTTVPVQAERGADAPDESPKVEVTLVVEIRNGGFHISALSDSLGAATLGKLRAEIPIVDGGYSFAAMTDHLAEVKEQYPASNTMLVIPEPATAVLVVLGCLGLAVARRA